MFGEHNKSLVGILLLLLFGKTEDFHIRWKIGGICCKSNACLKDVLCACYPWENR